MAFITFGPHGMQFCDGIGKLSVVYPPAHWEFRAVKLVCWRQLSNYTSVFLVYNVQIQRQVVVVVMTTPEKGIGKIEYAHLEKTFSCSPEVTNIFPVDIDKSVMCVICDAKKMCRVKIGDPTLVVSTAVPILDGSIKFPVHVEPRTTPVVINPKTKAIGLKKNAARLFPGTHFRVRNSNVDWVTVLDKTTLGITTPLLNIRLNIPDARSVVHVYGVDVSSEVRESVSSDDAMLVFAVVYYDKEASINRVCLASYLSDLAPSIVLGRSLTFDTGGWFNVSFDGTTCTLSDGKKQKVIVDSVDNMFNLGVGSKPNIAVFGNSDCAVPL
jgi:hypothetical protein